MDKRQKKISKVMSEFKDGTLKSGGSGKKVTNPKQAMAIAFAQANSLNQGGMLGDIYSRPMFQTPVQRAGGGIMAGVAPVNLQDGGDPGLMDYLSGIGSAIVGDDGTMDDFFSLEKTEEGSGLNLRDLTDVLIVDPEDPTDVAIAAATAPLLIFPPAAIAARLAAAGYKGTKVARAVDKAAEMQEKIPGLLSGGTSRLATLGQGQIAREVVPMAQEGAGAAVGGIADLVSPPAMAAGTEEEEDSSIFDSGALQGIGTGIAGLAAFSPKFRGLLKATGAAAGRGALKGLDVATDNPVKTATLAGAGYGASQLMGDEPEPPTPPSTTTTPQTSRIAEAQKQMEEEANTPQTEEEKQGFFANIMERLTDPRVQAGLANAAKPTEGYVPRNFFSDFNEGVRAYDLEQAKISNLTGGEETTFTANYEFLQEKFPESSPEELMDMALSLSNRGGKTTLINTLFRAEKERYPDMPTDQVLKRVQDMAAGMSSGAPTIDVDTGEVIKITAEDVD
mgnify:CR=1 FL=1